MQCSALGSMRCVRWAACAACAGRSAYAQRAGRYAQHARCSLAGTGYKSFSDLVEKLLTLKKLHKNLYNSTNTGHNSMVTKACHRKYVV